MGNLLLVSTTEVDGIAERLRERYHPDQVRVVFSAIPDSAPKRVMGDVDEAIEDAEHRVHEVVERLAEAGLKADGHVGDSDPVVAASDELQSFRADRVLFVVAAEDARSPSGEDLIVRAKRDLDVPVTRIVADGGGIEEVTEGADAEPPPDEIELTENLPPLRRTDALGLAVGITGTVALAILAGASDPNSFTGAARILIAIGAALLNLAHVVGLMLFNSVRYRGLWERFFARLSLFGTPLAIAVSVALGAL